MKSRFILLCASALFFAALSCERASAEPPYAPGPGILPIPGPFIPGPAIVPGKEYTPLGDMANPPFGGRGAAPYNVLQWDGFGGAIDVVSFAPFAPAGGSGEIDALASVTDALFAAVVSNSAALLVSSVGDPIDPVMVESIGGAVGTWATPAMVNFAGVGIPPGSPADLDALEVWGDNFVSDSTKFSLDTDSTTGVSVFTFTGVSVLPYITVSELAFGLGIEEPFWGLIDLDAMMVFDVGDPGPIPLWSPGDSILFSIAPIPVLGFDGGEIWVFTNGVPFGGATFLSHGGHLWDTANDVTALLGSEDVDALEAVAMIPEPSSMILAVFGAVSLAGYGLRRRNLQ